MLKRILFSVGILSLVCGCTPAVTTPPVEAPAQVAAAEPAPQAKFTNDIAASEIDRKKAELWEYLGAGFYVPLATMRDSDRAWALARLAQGPKAPSHVQQLVIGGTAYYRALLGPFKSKKEAEKQGKEFEKKKLLDTKIKVEYLAG